jgi:probable rRNA maturation factor
MSAISVQRCVPPAGIPAAASLRLWAQSALICGGPHPASGSAVGPPLSRKRERDASRRSAAVPDLGDLTIRIVGEAESESLNSQYRRKHKPTNVLSFGYGDDDEAGPHPTAGGSPLSRRRVRDSGRRYAANQVLGDLVICAPVVAREAKEQNKTVRAHWAHMVVHGCLHLQGHDHENERDAEAMEALEIRILEKLGFDNPYQEQ